MTESSPAVGAPADTPSRPAPRWHWPGFALGATFIGEEWSSRNVVAWLFYEPRRLRLLGAILLAVTTTVALLPPPGRNGPAIGHGSPVGGRLHRGHVAVSLPRRFTRGAQDASDGRPGVARRSHLRHRAGQFSFRPRLRQHRRPSTVQRRDGSPVGLGRLVVLEPLGELVAPVEDLVQTAGHPHHVPGFWRSYSNRNVIVHCDHLPCVSDDDTDLEQRPVGRGPDVHVQLEVTVLREQVDSVGDGVPEVFVGDLTLTAAGAGITCEER